MTGEAVFRTVLFNFLCSLPAVTGEAVIRTVLFNWHAAVLFNWCAACRQ